MTEITILNLLNTRPMYGAEMIEEIKRLSGNTVIMSLPTLYSSLHRMANKEYVRSYQKESAIGGRCRVYNITKYGREYLAKNPIKIDYQQIVDNSSISHKTFASLEEAFSLPLNKKPLVPSELPEDKRVLQITPQPATTTVSQADSTIARPKTESKTSLYAPYIAPDEKITTTPEQPHYQQTQIGLAGTTTGGEDLRPLVKLNNVSVGNDYVIINRLRVIAVMLTAAIFMLINFICSLTHNVCAECYSIIYITLFLYSLVWLTVYLIYPRIKMPFNLKNLVIRQVIFTFILIALVIICTLATDTYNILWLLIFAMFPLVRLLLMVALRKRSWFLC